MILRGARVAVGPDEAEKLDVEVRNGRIYDMRKPSTPPKGAVTIDLGGHLILPGLINAHDHLEFNLYPRLGRGRYPNAGAWSRDVYRPDESPLREHLAIPKSTRLFWGGLKNLLSGVTTVCHHNPRDQPIFDRNFPVRVLEQFGWAHSLEFSPDLADRFRATPADWPFILHLGEGVDRESKREIFRLDELGALDGRTILVHAVALGARELRFAKQRGAALVWCPSSNLFLLGRTLNGALSSGIPIALGSDSWMKSVKEELKLRLRSDDHPRSQRVIGEPHIGEVIAVVAKAFSADEHRIRERGGGLPRMAVAWLACNEAQLTYREIAAGLRLRSSGHVSDLIRRCDKEIDWNPVLRDHIDICIATLRRKHCEPKL